MKTSMLRITPYFLLGLFFVIFYSVTGYAQKGGVSGKPTGESAGNNLSFPVIWAEGIAKSLQGQPGEEPILNGEWWYQWGTNGTDPDITPASCPPDPDNSDLCDDGVVGSTSGPSPGAVEADHPMELVKAYLQKDPGNIWQAGSVDYSNNGRMYVDWVDWGDNLESVDWYTRSQVRIEVVLFEDLLSPLTEYEMRHTSGWGIDEVHGLACGLDGAVIMGPGDQATVYSHCARLTIQKLLVERTDTESLEQILWDPDLNQWVNDDGLIRDPIFNKAVYDAGDGPGYYSAEINVKGRVIYGYTWNVRQLRDLTGSPLTAAGDYRITFSFDQICGDVELYRNAFFDEGTKILVPLEEDVEAAAFSVDTESTDEGGGEAVLELGDGYELTYIDVRILERSSGKGGKE